MLTIKEKIAEIAAEYTSISTDELYQANRFSDLNIDSLTLVEMIFDIEEAFDISIPNEADLEKQGFSFSSFDDILNIVTALVKEVPADD